MSIVDKVKGFLGIKKEDIGITSKDLFSDATDDLDNKKGEFTDACTCKSCPDTIDRENCPINTKENSYLKEVLYKAEIDTNKDTILLVDDNEGIISFLIDDLKSLKKKGLFDYTQYNLLTIDSKLAGFKLRSLILSDQILNIKYGIYDITLGGTLFDNEGKNITLDGVDCYIDVAQVYPNSKYLFYTGNKLNPYIKKNEKTINKFCDFSGEDIEEHVLFKTSLNREERQAYLLNFFTEKK